ncbi:PhzF family phenazine biosynthesis protein [Paralimibaculum aggregatum]|uniref:PhzF family phenazine biosynthesis protein n=1 Tax=Paralimibaculum aggregatum TaxID=3036245 RepID=A0ABQ6LRJ8_9RHOB|nr:PhzF family phenazine biosynthesis protein [Limibaculum sp. NKW23]GMG84748.1 PhzF family phenazine biosynthesis protein [Limibaculum sp. NKW23]
MSAHRFAWADAFADRAMAGNPCAVVFDADAVSRETRIALVRETGLSECAYLQASAVADFGVRYYTAKDEIRFAGHPTIATCTVLEDAGLLAGRARFTLEVGSGVIPIEIDRAGARPVFTMTQAAPVFGESFAPGAVAAIYGLEAADIVGRPQIVSTGTAFVVTLLTGHDALRRAALDPARLAGFMAGVDHPEAWKMEPFLVTRTGATSAGDTFARLLLPPPMPPEDPFTGSATGCMAAWLWHHGLIEAPRFTAEQGHWMGRPGQAAVEVLGPPEAIGGVRLGGTGVVLMRGEVAL